MKKFFKIIFLAGASLLIVLTTLLVATFFRIPGNIKSYVVESGSMQPAIKTGSLVFIIPRQSYNVGDIITFGQSGFVPTTHRIVEIGNEHSQTLYKTKGDANGSTDGRAVPTAEIRGKVFLVLPYVGYIVYLARQPLGFAAVVLLPALLFVIDEIKNIWVEVGNIRARRARLKQESLYHE